MKRLAAIRAGWRTKDGRNNEPEHVYGGMTTVRPSVHPPVHFMIQQTVAARCRFYAGHKERDIKSHLITASHATPPHQHAANTSKGLSLFLSLVPESGERGAVFK
jgi:hypothetical protein